MSSAQERFALCAPCLKVKGLMRMCGDLLSALLILSALWVHFPALPRLL